MLILTVPRPSSQKPHLPPPSELQLPSPLIVLLAWAQGLGRKSMARCPVDFHGTKRIGILFWLVDCTLKEKGNPSQKVDFKGEPFPKKLTKGKRAPLVATGGRQAMDTCLQGSHWGAREFQPRRGCRTAPAPISEPHQAPELSRCSSTRNPPMPGLDSEVAVFFSHCCWFLGSSGWKKTAAGDPENSLSILPKPEPQKATLTSRSKLCG